MNYRKMLWRLMVALACFSGADANADGSSGEQRVEVIGDRIDCRAAPYTPGCTQIGNLVGRFDPFDSPTLNSLFESFFLHYKSEDSTAGLGGKHNVKEQGSEEVAATANLPADGYGCTGNPVEIASGAKLMAEDDIVVHGKYGMVLTRTYRSNSVSGMFGVWGSSLQGQSIGWSSSMVCSPEEAGGICRPAYAIVTDEAGRQWKYTLGGIGGAYRVQGNASMGVLTGSASGSTLLRDGLTYQFSSALSSLGRLMSIKSAGGTTLRTYAWNGYGPTRVTNAANQSIVFTWSGNRVVSAKDPANKVWSYAYDANGLLVEVRAPGTPADIRSYHYESPVAGYLLTGVSINGQLQTTNSYDSQRRVKTSARRDSEVADSFDYSGNTVTVTDALERQTVYTSETAANGRIRNAAVQTQGSIRCDATSASTTYDDKGYLRTTTDQNGNLTEYDYDTSGRLTRLTTAAGTGAAWTKTIVWSTQVPDYGTVEFLDASGQAYLRKTYTYHASGYAKGWLATETWTDLRLGGQRQWVHGYTFHSGGKISTESVSQVLPGGALATTTRTYNTLGQLTSFSNAAGHVTTWTRDALNA